MASLGAIRGCTEQAQVLDSDSVGQLVPAITHLFYDDAQLCLLHLSPGPAGNRPGRDPCPFLSPCLAFHCSTCRQALFVCRSLFGLVKCCLFLIRIRLLCASSRLPRLPALCLMPCALCLSSGFIVSTGDYKYRPCARFVFGSSGHINCDFLPLLSLSCTIFVPPVNKSRSQETEGLSKDVEVTRRSTRTSHTLTSSLQFRWDRHICYCRC